MNSHRWIIVLLACLTVFGLAACSSPEQRTAENEPAQAPSETPPTPAIVPDTTAPTSEWVGQLQTVDLAGSMVTVKNAEGTEETFSFSGLTEILGADNAQGLSTRQGNQVNVRYTEQDGRKMATRIEIVPK